MKKNIFFLLVNCELVITNLKKIPTNIIKLSFFSLILLVFSFTNKAFGQITTIFFENMGSPAATSPIASNIFQNNASCTFTGTADVRTTSPSAIATPCAAASGSGNVFITNAVGRDFFISGINTGNI